MVNRPTSPGCGVALLDQVVGLALERVEAVVAAVLDHQLEAAGVAQAVDRRRPEHADLGVLDLGEEPPAELGGDRVGRRVPRRAGRGTARG